MAPHDDKHPRMKTEAESLVALEVAVHAVSRKGLLDFTCTV